MEHTQMRSDIDALFKNNYRPVIKKKHCPETLSCSSKTKKSMKISMSDCRKENLH